MEALDESDPRSLGGYTLQGRLGAGGQGVVYLGRATSGRRVAVKALRPAVVADPVARRRFAGEVELVRKVSSFCVAEILDASLDGSRPYIVSEYVAGGSLQAVVEEQGPRTEGTLRRLAVGTLTALAAIHAAGIVHRDFKPHNVLLGEDGPRVIDFGIARLLESTATVTNQIVGTLMYMSPEQISGDHIGPASDMFSWASTMAYAASGSAPFGEDTVPAVMHRVLYGEPRLPELPADLTEIITACLAKDPGQRPSARDLLLRLIGDERPGDRPHSSVGAETSFDLPPAVPPAPGTGTAASPATGPTALMPGDSTPGDQVPGATAPTGSVSGATVHQPQALPSDGGPATRARAVVTSLAGRRRLLVAVSAALAVAAAVTVGVIMLRPDDDTPPPPAPVSGTVLYRDDFTERSGWDGWDYNPTAPGDQRTIHGYEIDRGVYTMTVDRVASTDNSLSPVPPKTPPDPAQIERNLVFSVLAEVRESSGTGAFGLLCLWNEDNASGYKLLIDQEGVARAVRRTEGVDQPVGPTARIAAPEAGRKLRLQAGCRQDGGSGRLTLWVDGKKIIEATDAPGLPEQPVSQIGLQLYVPESSNGVRTVSFDDFSVTRPR